MDKNQLISKNNYIKEMYRIFNLYSENSDKEIFDFISNKNKIKLNSCFDKKGTKKFLSDKEKAMAEITLFDEITDENTHKKSHHKHKKKKKPEHVRSISDNAIIRLKSHKKHKHKKYSDKHLDSVHKGKITINYIDEPKNNNNNINKKIVNKFNSIQSAVSKINSNEPLNLAVNKNDSLIISIVNEITKDKILY